MGYERPTSPHLDDLATGAIVFESHFAQQTYTRATLPQTLYSRYWTPRLSSGSARIPVGSPSELFLDLDAESVSLARALSDLGLHTVGISAHSWLLEESSFAREFDEFHDLASTTTYPEVYAYPRADQVTDAAIEWLTGHPNEEVFLYLHYMDTHFPHLFTEEARRFLDPRIDAPETAKRFSAAGFPRDRVAKLEGDERAYLDALYDGDVFYADRHLGRLFSYLRRRGILDHTLIVVTSDHGEHLLEVTGRFEHGGPWYDAVAHIPLILSYPARLEPARHAGISAAVDVAPTVLGLLGAGPPAGKRFDGEDLLPEVLGKSPARELVFSQFGVRSTGEKLILSPRARSRLSRFEDEDGSLNLSELDYELYDLTVDRGEARNLAELRSERAEELFAAYLETLGPLYERYIESVRTEAPRHPFAIEAQDFSLEPMPATAAEPGESREAPEPPAGWTLSSRSGHDYLLARPNAEAIQIHVSVPDGSYELSAAVRGDLTITVDGGPVGTVSGPPVEESHGGPGADAEDRVVEIGRTEVRAGRFRAELAPAHSNRAAAIRLLGFTPVGIDRDRQQAIDERLRTLGYID